MAGACLEIVVRKQHHCARMPAEHRGHLGRRLLLDQSKRPCDGFTNTSFRNRCASDKAVHRRIPIPKDRRNSPYLSSVFQSGLCGMEAIRSFRDRPSRTHTRHETLRLAAISDRASWCATTHVAFKKRHMHRFVDDSTERRSCHRVAVNTTLNAASVPRRTIADGSREARQTREPTPGKANDPRCKDTTRGSVFDSFA